MQKSHKLGKLNRHGVMMLLNTFFALGCQYLVNLLFKCSGFSQLQIPIEAVLFNSQQGGH